MEAAGAGSTDEEQEKLITRRGDEDEEEAGDKIINFGPCNFCQKLIQSFLKCLGLERDRSAAPPPPPPPYDDDDDDDDDPEAEYEGEERIGVRIQAVGATRRPRRPPVNSGRGGSIN